MSTFRFDVVVFGGTLSGCMAALTLARQGRTVAVLERLRNVGGMPVQGGLCLTDLGRMGPNCVGGLTEYYYNNCGGLWGMSVIEWLASRTQVDATGATVTRNEWIGTAAGNRYALNQMLAAASGITLVTGIRLEDVAVADFDGYRLITGITATQGTSTDTYVSSAGVYVDCSYEGWLPRLAGVSLMVGREGSSTFNERYAGFHGLGIKRISYPPLKSNGALYYSIKQLRGPDGKGVDLSGWNMYSNPTTVIDGVADRRVQGFCYRAHICENWPDGISLVDPDGWMQNPPPGFRPERYALFADRQYFLNGDVNEVHPGHRWVSRLGGFSTGIHGFALFQPPEYLAAGAQLHEINSGSGESYNFKRPSDYWLDGPESYVLGSWDDQIAYAEKQWQWQYGLLYYGANNPDVPEELTADMANLGLPPDEFPSGACYQHPDGTECVGWPEQLYVRVGPRIIAQYVMTERDALVSYGDGPPDPVCFADYTIDQHANENVCDMSGSGTFFSGMIVHSIHETQGDSSSPIIVSPATCAWQVSMRSLLPYRQQVANLIVGCCVGATNCAASSLRMETTYGMLGEAAGAIAAAAIATRVYPADVAYADVRAILLEQGAKLDWRWITEAFQSSDLVPVTVLVGADGDGLTGADGEALEVTDAMPIGTDLDGPVFAPGAYGVSDGTEWG